MSQSRNEARTPTALICVWVAQPASGRLECHWTRPAQPALESAKGFSAAA